MIVIPMAGQSSRFAARGYLQPKFMLDLHGRPVFDYALARFAEAFDSEPFLLVVRDDPGVVDFVRARLDALGVRRYRLVELGQPTRGQAESVALGVRAANVPAHEPLTIFNIDTFVAGPHRDLGRAHPDAAGVLEVIRSEGANWSFVEPLPGTSCRVRRTTEKVPISDLCCTGLYWFRRADHFLGALDRETRSPQAAELYVAPLYNHLIAAGEAVEYDLIANEDLVLCGVPDEFEDLRHLDLGSGVRLFAIRDRLARLG